MARLSLLAFTLFAITCYTLASSKSVNSDESALTNKPSITPHRSNSEHNVSIRQISSGARDELRQKRSQLDLTKYWDSNDSDLEYNVIGQGPSSGKMVSVSQEEDLENMSLQTYAHLLQLINRLLKPTHRVHTPRTGRSIDIQLLDSVDNDDGDGEIGGVGGGGSGGIGGGIGNGVSRPFVSRIIKKSVPFKPRLGKRVGPWCD